MELLDKWHPVEDGYRRMMPADDDAQGKARYQQLANLERELFGWWCELIFRPEGPKIGGMMATLTGGAADSMSGAMKGFLECLSRVDAALAATAGPWFFADTDHPTMMDFIYVSHVERMLASCAYWKGLDLRAAAYCERFPALNRGLDAFEKREAYLAFKSDYYTHVMDIPPQYGPGYDGGFADDRATHQKSVRGEDGRSWTLPLPHDDPLQPLYRGPPLPRCVLAAAGIAGDDGRVGAEGTSYEDADPARRARGGQESPQGVRGRARRPLRAAGHATGAARRRGVAGGVRTPPGGRGRPRGGLGGNDGDAGGQRRRWPGAGRGGRAALPAGPGRRAPGPAPGGRAADAGSLERRDRRAALTPDGSEGVSIHVRKSE